MSDGGNGVSRNASIERALAPHVDVRWAEALLMELRLLGVPGDRIGQVLTEVESHVVDSGESAQEAFGDAVPYARSLALAPAPEQSCGAIAATLVPTVLQVLGMVAAITGAFALTGSEGAAITVGGVVSAVALLALVTILAFNGTRALRLLLHSWPVGVAVLTATFLAVVLPAALLRTVLVTVPAMPVLIGGAALLVVTTVADVVLTLRDGVDAVTSPVPGGDAPPRPSRTALLLSHLAMPAVAVALVVVVLLLR